MRKSGIYRVRHKQYPRDIDVGLVGTHDWEFAKWNAATTNGTGGFWEYFGGEDWYYDADLAEIDENPIALSPEQPKLTINDVECRTAFEVWVAGQNVCKKYGAKVRMNPDGSYKDFRINDRWNAWKAAHRWMVHQIT